MTVFARQGRCTVAVCLALVGCGDARLPTYPVRGSVKFTDGEPVRSGTIELQSIEHGTTAAGAIRPDGTFVLGTYDSDDGAVAGSHRAIVVQLIIADGLSQHVRDHGRRVSPRFGDYGTSGLTVDVAPAKQNEVVVTLDQPTLDRP